MKVEDATAGSPLVAGPFTGEGTPQKAYDIKGQTLMASALDNARRPIPDAAQVMRVLNGLDGQSRWLQRGVSISHPYTKDGGPGEATDEYASTHVGDEADTSPYQDESEQLYVSTGTYLRNMSVLIDYVKANRK